MICSISVSFQFQSHFKKNFRVVGCTLENEHKQIRRYRGTLLLSGEKIELSRSFLFLNIGRIFNNIISFFFFFSSNQQSGLFWPCSLDFIISNLTESAIIWANSSEIQSGVSPSLFNALDPVLRNSSSAPSASSLLIWTSSAFKLGEKRSFLFRFLFLLERVLEKDEIISGH